MNFKISNKMKEELLQDLNIEKKLEREFENLEEDFEGKEDLLEEIYNDSLRDLKKDIEKLKNENILSKQLVKYFKGAFTEEQIELEDEQIEEIISNLSEKENEFNKDIIQEIQNSKKVKISYLAELTSIESTEKKEEITLDSDMKKMLKVVDETRSAQNNDERTKRIEEALKKGKIQYRDYEYLTGDMGIKRDNANKQEINEFMYLYREGLISEEKLYKILGMKEFNSGVIDYVKEYSNKKENRINDWTYSIKEIIENIPQDIPDETKEKFNNILKEIDNSKGKNKEELIKDFNNASSEVWKEFLNSDKRMLFHETTSPLKGKFRDGTMSTSLIENDHLNTYRNEWVGYKVNPIKILTARSSDAYVFNAKRDKYVQPTDMIVDLPQNVSDKMKEEKSFSEIAVTEYDIESAVILDPNNKEKLELVKKLAEAQNVPIDTYNGKRFLPIEEFFLDEKINNSMEKLNSIRDYRQEIDRLGLKDFSKDIDFYKNEIDNKFKELQEKKKILSREEMTKISDGIDLDKTGKIAEICNLQLNEDYQKAIDEKIKNLIKNSKIEQITNQEESLKREKSSFLEKIFGKNRLQKARIESLNIKKEEINLEEIIAEPNEKESISNLLSYIRQNGANDEIKNFLKNYNELCTDQQIREQIKQYKMIEMNKMQDSNKEKAISTRKAPLFQILSETKRMEKDNLIKRQNIDIARLKEERDRRKQRAFKDSIKINENNSVKSLENFKDYLEQATRNDNISVTRNEQFEK